MKDRLFAACFKPDKKDELDKALDFWRNFEDLRVVFMQYRNDLTAYAPGMKVTHAVEQVQTRAETIYDRLIEFSKRNKLEELFKPLDDREDEESGYELQKIKAKSGIRKGMLRLYVVKYGDWFVITGSAIKLTDKMDKRLHLNQELKKLELVRKFLQKGSSEGSFVYLDI